MRFEQIEEKFVYRMNMRFQENPDATQEARNAIQDHKIEELGKRVDGLFIALNEEIAERASCTDRWTGKNEALKYEAYIRDKGDIKRIITKSVDKNREMREWVKLELNMLTPTSNQANEAELKD